MTILPFLAGHTKANLEQFTQSFQLPSKCNSMVISRLLCSIGNSDFYFSYLKIDICKDRCYVKLLYAGGTYLL